MRRKVGQEASVMGDIELEETVTGNQAAADLLCSIFD